MKAAAVLLIAVLLVPLLLLAVVAAGASALANPLNHLPGGDPFGPLVQAIGPVYYASTASVSGGDDAIRRVSIHDLGFGPSDAPRIEHLIATIQAVLWLLLLVYIYGRLLGGSLSIDDDRGRALVLGVAADLLFLGAAVGAAWTPFVLARDLCRLRRRAIVAALIVSVVYAVGIILSHTHDLLPIGIYFPFLPWGIVPLLPLGVTLPIVAGLSPFGLVSIYLTPTFSINRGLSLLSLHYLCLLRRTSTRETHRSRIFRLMGRRVLPAVGNLPGVRGVGGVAVAGGETSMARRTVP